MTKTMKLPVLLPDIRALVVPIPIHRLVPIPITAAAVPARRAVGHVTRRRSRALHQSCRSYIFSTQTRSLVITACNNLAINRV